MQKITFIIVATGAIAIGTFFNYMIASDSSSSGSRSYIGGGGGYSGGGGGHK